MKDINCGVVADLGGMAETCGRDSSAEGLPEDLSVPSFKMTKSTAASTTARPERVRSTERISRPTTAVVLAVLLIGRSCVVIAPRV
jgi:hypothetical protein